MSLSVSVIIVSNQRPEALRRCLIGVRQLNYPSFEIVVVADAPAVDGLEPTPLGQGIKWVRFDAENISDARNLGIAEAAGDVVAFVDDDAVPEPTWLTHLIAPFATAEVAAAGGFVRGRNGVSWQWQGASVDMLGRRHPISLDSNAPVVLHPVQGRAIKTEGTNMALRRDVIAAMGGFDPAFRFFLDETDVNVRLARAGHATALVPRAEVHHGFAESNRRRADRVPRDLFEIGASLSAFLLRHCPEGAQAARREDFQQEQSRRLLRHMVAGRLEPRDVRRLMARLKDGFDEGDKRLPEKRRTLPRACHGFQQVQTPALTPKFITGAFSHRSNLRQRAAEAVRAGHVTTLFLFSPTALYGRVHFSPDGYWEHVGGQFGKMTRSEPLFNLQSRKEKVRKEYARIADVRGLG